jgi:putative flippase GtrA
LNFLKAILINFSLKSFRSFLIVGAIVFLFDYILYQLLIEYLSSLNSRFISYTISTWCAWFLNLRFSFGRIKGSFVKYFFGASIAGIQNVLLSIYFVKLFGHSYTFDFISIGIGCAYGLFFNFMFQSMITFRKS